MPKVNASVVHTLGKDEAVRRLKEHSETLQRQWADKLTGYAEEWKGDVLEVSFKVFGFPVRGFVTPAEDDVDVLVELPTAAIMLQGAVKSQITKELAAILA